MEELKSLIEMVKDAPNLVVGLVAIYFFFKIVVVGSIYGTLRYGITKFNESYKSKVEANKQVELDRLKASRSVEESKELNGLLVNDEATYALTDLLKLLRSYNGINSKFVHASDIEKLNKIFKEKVGKNG